MGDVPPGLSACVAPPSRRGLLLHDAFLLFDQDDDGLLSLREVFAALKWLNVPRVRIDDVIRLVRSLSPHPQLPYSAFIELLSSGDGEEAVVAAGEADVAAGEADMAAGGGAEGGVHLADGGEAVVADFEATAASAAAQASVLESCWAEAVRAERALEERLEVQIVEQAESARKLAEAQLLDADFSWMRECKAEARNPRTTRTSCSYDFTRGRAGSQKGAAVDGGAWRLAACAAGLGACRA